MKKKQLPFEFKEKITYVYKSVGDSKVVESDISYQLPQEQLTEAFRNAPNEKERTLIKKNYYYLSSLLQQPIDENFFNVKK